MDDAFYNKSKMCFLRKGQFALPAMFMLPFGAGTLHYNGDL